MRTADDSQPSGDGSSTELGDGFDLSFEEITGGFGSDLDEDFDASGGRDDTSDDSSDETGEGTSAGSDDGGTTGLGVEDVAELSEAEAEEALVDLLEDEGLPTGEAERLVDDVQEDTGLSAGELLEDYVEYDTYDDTSAGADGRGLGFDGDGLHGPDPLAADQTAGQPASGDGGFGLDLGG